MIGLIIQNNARDESFISCLCVSGQHRSSNPYCQLNSLFQWGKAARVNQLWRNASLLPTGASYDTLHVTSSYQYDNRNIGESACRTLRSLDHTNRSLLAASKASSIHSISNHHPLTHIQSFALLDPSHPIYQQKKIGDNLTLMSSTLSRLVLCGSAVSLTHLNVFTQLRQLELYGTQMSSLIITIIPHLSQLEYINITPNLEVEIRR